MHCGPDEDDCGTVLRDVWLFLDDELDPERRAAVQRHLDGCSPCLEQADLQYKLKQLLSRKCGGDRAPERLRQRVVASLLQVRAGSDAGVTSLTATSVSVRWDSLTGEDSAGVGRDGATDRPEGRQVGGDEDPAGAAGR